MQFQNYMWMMKEARAAYRLVTSSAPPLSPHSLCSGQALSRSEGSGALGSEMLRGVDPECNAWAQQDRDVTYSDGRITVFICMIGLSGHSFIQLFFETTLSALGGCNKVRIKKLKCIYSEHTLFQ
jgi:hypothetical protein